MRVYQDEEPHSVTTSVFPSQGPALRILRCDQFRRHYVEETLELQYSPTVQLHCYGPGELKTTKYCLR